MKNLGEVISAVKSEKEVSEQELRLAVLCLSHLAFAFIRKIIKADKAKIPRLILDAKWNERFYRNALAQPMLEFLGPENTPGTPEYKKAVEWAKSVLDKVSVEKQN